MKKFRGLFEQHREVGRFKPVKPHDVKPVGPRPAVDSASAGLKEGSVQDKLYAQHQALRKKSGLPHPDYYKELGKSYDIEDHEERAKKQSEIRTKYGQQREEMEISEASFTSSTTLYGATRKQHNTSQEPTHNIRIGDSVKTSDGKKGNVSFVDGDTVHVKGSNQYYPDKVTQHKSAELKKEEVEELDEVSKEVLTRYSNTAKTQAQHDMAKISTSKTPEEASKHGARAQKRFVGYHTAQRKMKEETEVEKNSAAARTYKEKPEKQPMEKMKEEIQQIDEISDTTKASYTTKAKEQIKQTEPFTKKGEYRDIAKNFIAKRKKGIIRANEAKEMKGEDPCWKGYEMVGQKMKNGKKVPNCVPVKEEKRYVPSQHSNDVPKKPKGEYERKVEKYLKKKYAKEEVEIQENISSLKEVAKNALQRQVSEMKTFKESLQESRKAEIVRDIVKKKKKETKESDDKFQPDPELSSQIVKEDK